MSWKCGAGIFFQNLKIVTFLLCQVLCYIINKFCALPKNRFLTQFLTLHNADSADSGNWILTRAALMIPMTNQGTSGKSHLRSDFWLISKENHLRSYAEYVFGWNNLARLVMTVENRKTANYQWKTWGWTIVRRYLDEILDHWRHIWAYSFVTSKYTIFHIWQGVVVYPLISVETKISDEAVGRRVFLGENDKIC